MLQRAPPTDHGPWEGPRSVKLETRSRMIKSTAIGRTLNWSMERLGARTPRVAHLLLNRNSRSRRSSRSSGITLLVNPFGNARNLFRVPRKMQIASYQKPLAMKKSYVLIALLLLFRHRCLVQLVAEYRRKLSDQSDMLQKLRLDVCLMLRENSFSLLRSMH